MAFFTNFCHEFQAHQLSSEQVCKCYRQNTIFYFFELLKLTYRMFHNSICNNNVLVKTYKKIMIGIVEDNKKARTSVDNPLNSILADNK